MNGALPHPVKSTRPGVSGVMPIHNEATVLNQVLKSVADQTHVLDEIVLVFDRCTDSSQQVPRPLSTRDLVVDFGNTGNAVRGGIESATFDTIILFDGNTWVPRDYVERLLRSFANTRADITEWHGGLMLLPKATVDSFGPPSGRALWTLELFLRVKAGGGTVVHLKGEFARLKRSPLHRNFLYGLDYADFSWQYGLAPFFRVGTKSGLVEDIFASAGVVFGHARRKRLIPAIARLLGDRSTV